MKAGKKTPLSSRYSCYDLVSHAEPGQRRTRRDALWRLLRVDVEVDLQLVGNPKGVHGTAEERFDQPRQVVEIKEEKERFEVTIEPVNGQLLNDDEE